MSRERSKRLSGLLALFGPLLALTLSGAQQACSHTGAAYGKGRSHAAPRSARSGRMLRGEASYYSNALSGRRTASGERYDPKKYTAAHRSLPFGTRLRVTRVDTGESVEVRVNDRGPFGHRRRILDLSRAAARDLGMIRKGTIDIEAVVLP